tara:strand:+ start:389 stop:1288 length:900 start_codon:yes stop_codon:yes gene_type:complete
MDSENIVVYDIDFINKLSSTFNAILDIDIQNNLLEIKKNNKFIRRRSPIRLKYQISVADKWRDSRLNNNIEKDDKYKNSLISNLNKISNVNYPQIITIIKDLFCEIDNDLRLDLIETICDKAITENIYSNLYAKLLFDLNQIYPEIKRIVINKCNEFFNTTRDNISELTDTDDYNELCDIIRSKARIIGGFVFIANLYKYEMVSYDIVLSYYNKLIAYTKAAPIDYIGKYIDAIVSIIDNCGEDLEKYNKAVFKNNFMDLCFDLINNKEKLPAKYRFKLMGVCDKYNSNWKESDEWNKV